MYIKYSYIVGTLYKNIKTRKEMRERPIGVLSSIISMNIKKIEWITFNAFLDTDLYIVKELVQYYRINWYIVKSGNESVDYLEEVSALRNIQNLNIEIIKCGSRLRKIECIKSYNQLLNRVKTNNPDIIYTTLAGAPYFIPMVITKLNLKKVILAIHNVHVPKGGTAALFFKIYNSLAIKYFKNFQTFSISQYNYLLGVTNRKNVFQATFIMKDYGNPTKHRTNNCVTFLNFGNIRPYKRLDVLILAAQSAYEKTNILFKVIIAGKCDIWEEYQKLIKYDFLFDVRIGRVKNSEVPNLFEDADYFVAPYQDIAQSGSATVAINYSKPVIASKLPAFEEYVIHGKTGYLIEPADQKSLQDIMEYILVNHEQIYPELVENVITCKNEVFSTNAIVNKYREALDGI